MAPARPSQPRFAVALLFSQFVGGLVASHLLGGCSTADLDSVAHVDRSVSAIAAGQTVAADSYPRSDRRNMLYEEVRFVVAE